MTKLTCLGVHSEVLESWCRKATKGPLVWWCSEWQRHQHIETAHFCRPNIRWRHLRNPPFWKVRVRSVSQGYTQLGSFVTDKSSSNHGTQQGLQSLEKATKSKPFWRTWKTTKLGDRKCSSVVGNQWFWFCIYIRGQNEK